MSSKEIEIMECLAHSKKMAMWLQVALLGCVLMLSGCFPQSVPMAILPVVEPEAAALNLKGIDAYHRGEWEAALHLFETAIEINSTLVEAHFNAALALMGFFRSLSQ
jgi:hypothetical protein